MENSDDIINIFIIYRASAVVTVQHKGSSFIQSHIPVNGNHLISVGHDILGFLFPVGENIGYHLRLTLLNQALFMALLKHIDNFFLQLVPVLVLIPNTEKKH